MSTHTSDVIIIGGGMVGLSLGIALGKAGVAACVIEKDHLPDQLLPEFDGRVSAISLGSVRVLEGIGAWHHMQPEAQPIYDIRVVDGYSTAHAHYHYKDVGDTPVGQMVENRHIRQGLLRAAEQTANLTLLTAQKTCSIQRDAFGVTVTLEDGTTCHAKLLAAADGRFSAVRKEAGISTRELTYKQAAIVCTIEHTLPHEGLALQRFLPAGPFAALPMKGNRCAVVWSEDKERVPALLALSAEAFDAEIARRLGDYLGEVHAVGKRFSYPLSLVLAKDYTSTRLALVGDAAHGIHPVAGQGVNVGFRDVAVLAQLVEDAKIEGLDIGAPALLQRYQQWRRLDITTMSAATDGITRLFSNDISLLRFGRDAGLRLVNHAPPLKRLFMRQAMGLTGNLPRLMQEKRTA